jgi:copper transport protein
MMVRMRTIVAIAAAVAAALAVPSLALAHANLVLSRPADGAVLATPPAMIRLFFDDAVRAQSGMRAVRNGGGSVLDGQPRVVGGRELIIPLRPRLPHGDYTILWRVLSNDGHPIDGITTFAVGAGRAPPRAAFAAPSEQSPSQIIARWLFFAGILAASGSAIFRLVMPRSAAPPLRLLLVSFLLVVAGGVVLAQRASLSTRFGVVVGAAAAAAAAGAATVLVAGRYPRVASGAWLVAVLLLPAPTLAGHALDVGQPTLEVPVDLLHVAAASVWLGGLLSLALHLRRGDSSETVVRRFSTLALGSVLVLAATGLIRAFAELGAVHQLWSTSYGRFLIAKTVLLGILVAIGWANRYRVIPRLVGRRPALLRNVVAELLLFVGLISAVAFLTQARPGSHRIVRLAAAAAVRKPAPASPSPSGAVVLAQEGGVLQVGGRATAAVAMGSRYVFWETVASDTDATTALVERDLRLRQTRVVATDVASQYPLFSIAPWIVYATATVPSRLMALRRGARPVRLASGLVGNFAARGKRVAWAEQDGGRVRVVVRDMTTAKDWIAADLPVCENGRCYRIDAVTLADRGVVFDRGAIGSQPSLVVRRAFGADPSEVVRIANDPQPDLVPSSSGAAYYALGRGWYRWDFGRSAPIPAGLSPLAQPIRYERGRWFLLAHTACADGLSVDLGAGRSAVLDTAATIRRLANVGSNLCVSFGGLSWRGNRPLTTWAVVPRDSHSEAGVTSLILVGRPLS